MLTRAFRILNLLVAAKCLARYKNLEYVFFSYVATRKNRGNTVLFRLLIVLLLSMIYDAMLRIRRDNLNIINAS